MLSKLASVAASVGVAFTFAARVSGEVVPVAFKSEIISAVTPVIVALA